MPKMPENPNCLHSPITCESDVASHAEVLLRLLFVAREAVDDAVRQAAVAVQLQQADHLGVGLALVQEQGLLQLARQLDLDLFLQSYLIHLLMHFYGHALVPSSSKGTQ